VKKTIALLGSALIVSASGLAMAGGDVAAGKAKAAVCAGCHGANGVSNNPMYPNIAGQHEQYLVKAMQAYKAGDRGDPTMKAMAAPLSNRDIANLAAYFSSLSCK
jgi:cytochrome c553